MTAWKHMGKGSSPPCFPWSKMRLRDIGIELDTQTRFVLYGQVPALPDRPFVNHQIRPPVDVVRQFVDPEVSHRRSGMRGSNSADRARPIMSGSPNTVARSEIRDPLRFEQASGFRDVDVDAVRSLEFDQLLKPGEAVQVFAR